MPVIDPTFCRIGRQAILFGLLLVLLYSFAPPRGVNLTGKAVGRDTIIESSKGEWDSLVRRVWVRKSKLLNKVDSIGKSLRRQRRRKQNADSGLYLYVKESIKQLDTVICDLNALAQSPQDYALDTVKEKETSYTNYQPGKEWGKGLITFHIHAHSPASLIHETAHGTQFQHGSIAYTEDGVNFLGVDYNDELQAYKHEFAYDPTNVSNLPSIVYPTSYDSITVFWLLNLKDPESQVAIYNSWLFARYPIDVNSDTLALKAAYPDSTRWRRNPDLYPLKDAAFCHFMEKTDDGCPGFQTSGYLIFPPNHAIIPTPISIADSSILKVGVCTPDVIPFSVFITPSR
jgi:hypothetical protein